MTSMEADLPLGLSAVFILCVAAVYAALFWKVFRRLRLGGLVGALILLWIVLLGGLSSAGFFSAGLGLFPPKVALVLVVAVLFLGWLAFSPRVKRALERVELMDLVWIQMFRLPLELILWALVRRGILPVEMSFEGRNFDVLIGLSAPFVVWAYSRGGLKERGLGLWNLLGISLVFNVVSIGILSAPGVRVVPTDIPNFIISFFPFIWLPGFLVPTAFALHILCLRKLRHDARIAQAAA